jgi:hypothetical protein
VRPVEQSCCTLTTPLPRPGPASTSNSTYVLNYSLLSPPPPPHTISKRPCKHVVCYHVPLPPPPSSPAFTVHKACTLAPKKVPDLTTDKGKWEARVKQEIEESGRRLVPETEVTKAILYVLYLSFVLPLPPPCSPSISFLRLLVSTLAACCLFQHLPPVARFNTYRLLLVSTFSASMYTIQL